MNYFIDSKEVFNRIKLTGLFDKIDKELDAVSPEKMKKRRRQTFDKDKSATTDIDTSNLNINFPVSPKELIDPVKLPINAVSKLSTSVVLDSTSKEKQKVQGIIVHNIAKSSVVTTNASQPSNITQSNHIPDGQKLNSCKTSFGQVVVYSNEFKQYGVIFDNFEEFVKKLQVGELCLCFSPYCNSSFTNRKIMQNS